MTKTKTELSPGGNQYLVTGLWSTLDYEDQGGFNEHMDAKYSVDDISEEFKKQAQQDFDLFYAKTQNLFQESELDFEQIGHDFWLTRNGHRAGFWDGDYKNGDVLTEIVKKHFKPNEDELRESVE